MEGDIFESQEGKLTFFESEEGKAVKFTFMGLYQRPSSGNNVVVRASVGVY